MSQPSHTTGNTVGHVTWLLTRLRTEIPTIERAVLVSTDGLHLASSGHLDRAHAESAAALTSAFLSVTRQLGAVLQLGAAPDVLTLRYPDGHLALLRIDDRSGRVAAALLVAATPPTQLAALGYAMTTFGQQIGHVLTPETCYGMHQQTLTTAK